MVKRSSTVMTLPLERIRSGCAHAMAGRAAKNRRFRVCRMGDASRIIAPQLGIKYVVLLGGAMRKAALFAMVFCLSAFAQQKGKQQASLPEGSEKNLVATACTTCHAETMITQNGHTREDWKLVVERMVSAGAEIPQNRMAAVTDYLAKNFPEGNIAKAVIVP